MTSETMRNFYNTMIRHYTHNIEFCSGQIEWYTGQIQRSRAKDKEMVEWVWSKGVLTSFEARIYTKDYQSTETKKLIKERAKHYRDRKQSERRLAEYTRLLEA